MKKSLVSIFACMMVLLFVFTACAPAAPAEQPAAPAEQPAAPAEQPAAPAEQPAAPVEQPAAPAEPSVAKPLKVGLSNTFMYPWRAQMIDDITRVFDTYKAKGWLDGDLIIQHAGTDTNAQITQIRNMINSGIDILLINPISADGLNTVAEEAVAKGITVIAFDQAITAKGVYNVTIDHYTWGFKFADWLCNELGGKGDIVYIEGLPGHPANDDRVAGWKDAVAKYPDVKIVGNAVGNWDNPGAQKAASQLISTNPNLAGILSMDGMALGIYNALRASKKLDKIVTTGETQVAVLKEWKVILDDYPAFSSFGIVNPPGIGATALAFGVRIAQGREFTGEFVNGNTYYYQAGVQVDKTNFEEFYTRFVLTEGRPDSYYPDEWLSEEQVEALFK